MMSKSQLVESKISQVAVEIGVRARKALLEEVVTTPKPGLVDFYSSGAHNDMDIHTFRKSADALFPYFIYMAEQGYTLLCTPQELFQAIRKTGIAAEQAMYQATDGVNTHKGLIFTIGIFCAVAGRCLREKNGEICLETLIQMEQEMVSDTLKKELLTIYTGNAVSHGEKNLKKYGRTGVRGEAIDGYPAVVNIAIPVMQKGLKEKKDWNRVKLQTLFVLMSEVEDSNVLARHNPQVLREVQKEAKYFIESGGAYSQNAIAKLCYMDTDYIRKNISSGGCADLLATAIFIVLLLERW